MLVSDKSLETLDGGRLLPLVEEFYTLQGEGNNTGRAAYFIRLGGCDVGCSWCDAKNTWNPALYPPVPVEEIVASVISSGAVSAVITGGEPLKYPLDPLCCLLRSKGIEIFLETSGTERFSGDFDWVCLSPKKKRHPLEEMYSHADELKVVIETAEDFAWAEENALKVRKECLLYLQPEWSRSSVIMPDIIEYVKKNPKWRVSLQTHKFMNIP